MTEYYSLESDGPAAHQRRTAYVRDDDWIRDFLRRGQVAHIATRWDDQPFVTPTNYYYDEASHRLIFHSNITGRLRANIERHPRIAAEVSEIGRALPSNIAFEFSQQYRSVMVFGEARVIQDVTGASATGSDSTQAATSRHSRRRSILKQQTMTTQPHYQLQATVNGDTVRDLIEALQKLDPDLIVSGIGSVRRCGNGLEFDDFGTVQPTSIKDFGTR